LKFNIYFNGDVQCLKFEVVKRKWKKLTDLKWWRGIDWFEMVKRNWLVLCLALLCKC